MLLRFACGSVVLFSVVPIWMVPSWVVPIWVVPIWVVPAGAMHRRSQAHRSDGSGFAYSLLGISTLTLTSPGTIESLPPFWM